MRRLVTMTTVLLACSNGEPGEPSGPDPETSAVRVVEVASGLNDPVHLIAPAGDARLFVVEQPGRIRIIREGSLLPAPFLDITDKVGFGGERGLLSMAFDPDYAATGRFWVNYTDRSGTTHIERYTVSSNADVADPQSATLVLEVAQPYGNHNGGHILFGPDGLLYIGMGDGGSGDDPHGHGQDRGTLLGAILRIDVRSASPYAIPPGNPYVNTPDARPEIWATGVRNPWRLDFDTATGLFLVADVGQNQFEEINAQPASQGGLNYGWNIMEGQHCFGASSCAQQGLVQPVHEYDHGEGCSIAGGYVYRGSRLTGLQGHYFYSDYCDGWLRSLRVANGTATDHRNWNIADVGDVLSFGEDSAGELYLLSANGRVYRIDPD